MDLRSTARTWALPAGIALALGVLYYLAGPDQQTEDANRYLFSIETGWRLWDPHHLLYCPAMRLVFLAADGVGAVSRAYNVARLANALVAGAGPVLLAMVALAAGARRTVAWGAAAVLALAPAWVRYSTVVETYHAPIAIMLAGLLVWLRARERDGAGWWLGAGAAFGLAGLFHQSAALSGLALAVATLIGNGGSPRERLRRTALVCAGGGGVALAGFAAAGAALGHRTPAALLDWMRGLQGTSSIWGRWEHFAPSEMKRHAEAIGDAWLPFGRSALAGIALAVAGVAALVAARRTSLPVFAVIAAFAHAVFNVWWAPWEWEFVLLPGAWTLLAMAIAFDGALARVGEERARVAAGIAALLIIVAGGATWRQQALAHRDRLASRSVAVAFALEAVRASAGEDALLVADFAVRDALHLYADAPPVVAFEDLLEDDGPRRVRAAMAAGCNVVVDAIPPGIPMRDDRVAGTDRAVKALLRSLAEGSGIAVPAADAYPDELPMPRPIAALDRPARALAFHRDAPRSPRAAVAATMLDAVEGTLRIQLPPEDAVPLRDAMAGTTTAE